MLPLFGRSSVGSKQRSVLNGLVLTLASMALMTAGAGCSSGATDDKATITSTSMSAPTRLPTDSTTPDSVSDAQGDSIPTTTIATSPPDETRPGDDGQAAGSPPANLPPEIPLPASISVTGTTSAPDGSLTITANCSGKGSTVLTDMTAALNNAGFETKWVMSAASDPNAPAVLEGRLDSKLVRSTITTDSEGTCQKVVVTYTS